MTAIDDAVDRLAPGGPLPALSPVQLPGSLGDLVFARVRDAIVTRALPPGERIGEAVLAGQLGVSRTPVRETLWRLRQMGLVEAVGPRGYRVALPSREAIEHAYELREALEGFGAAAAAERGSDVELDEVLQSARASLEAAESGDARAFRKNDEHFHRLVSTLAGNPRLLALTEDAWALTATLRARDVPHERASVPCGSAHVAVGEALLRRDRSAAAEGMARHVRQVRDHVLEASLASADHASPRKDDR